MVRKVLLVLLLGLFTLSPMLGCSGPSSTDSGTGGDTGSNTTAAE